tara:strand:+ start:7822 stop:9870 length:2049 start_codon:yes stop_codon:yes gene_type:complete
MANKVSYIIELRERVLKTAGKVNNSLNKINKTVNKLTPSLGGLTSQMAGLASAAAVGAIFVKTTQGILEFETGLVGVGKTTGLAGEQLKALGDSVLVTSKQLQTISSDKLLELAQVAGQLGIKGEESILKFATVLAKLEGASDIKGEEGAASIARLLTITGEGVGIVDRFAASLVGLGNNSAATESEILSVASEVARSTAAFKLSSSEILGISTALKSLDVAPEAAGTAIAQVFRGIELATINGGEKLQNFAAIMGQTTESVKENFAKAPLESFETFIKGLNRVSNEGGSLTKSLQDVGLSGLIVSKGIVPLATNFDLLHDKLALANKGFMENTAVNEEFAASQKTVQSGLNAVAIAFQNTFTQIATSGSALGSLQDALFFISTNMETIIAVLGVAAGSFAALKTVMLVITAVTAAYNIVLGISTALTGGSALALQSSTIAMSAYKTVTAIATAGQWLWNAALITGAAAMAVLTSPIFLVAAAIGILVSGIMAFRNNWDNIVNAFETGSLVDGFKAIGVTILDAVLMPLQKMLELMGRIPGLGGLAKGAAQSVEDLRNRIGIDNTQTEESKRFSGIANEFASGARSRIANKFAAGKLAAQDPFARGSIKAPAGATTGAAADVAGAGTTVKSAAPKVFNLQIGSLIQEVNITKTTTTESITEFTNMLKESLLGTLNDVQTELA